MIFVSVGTDAEAVAIRIGNWLIPKIQELGRWLAKAQRAGLDDEASTVFAERQGNYRRGVPAVPQTYRRIGDGTAIDGLRALAAAAWAVHDRRGSLDASQVAEALDQLAAHGLNIR